MDPDLEYSSLFYVGTLE